MDTKIEIYGVKAAIKELRTLDPEMRKDINREAKELAKPVIDAAKRNYPPQFLSGMSRKWSDRGRQVFPYDQGKALKGVVLKIDTSKKNQGLIVVIQKDPAASIIDMAGKKGGSNKRGESMIAALTLYFGPPSRVMWPAYEQNAAAVEQGFRELIEKVMDRIGRNLVTK